MSDFPNTIFNQRTIQNVNGVVYDPANTKVVYAEDMQNVGAEVEAIEEALGAEFSNIRSSSVSRSMTALGFPAKFLSNFCEAPSTTLTMVDGRIYINTIFVDILTTITGVGIILTTAGIYTANNFNGIALYEWTGTEWDQIAITANDASFLQGGASEYTQVPFTSPIDLPVGVYMLAIQYNSSAQTTAPRITRGLSTLQGDFANLSANNPAQLSGNLIGYDLPLATITPLDINPGSDTPLFVLY